MLSLSFFFKDTNFVVTFVQGVLVIQAVIPVTFSRAELARYKGRFLGEFISGSFNSVTGY